MLNTGRAVQALVAQVSELTTQLQLLRSPAAPPTPPILPVPGNNNPQHEPRLPTPEVYAGDPNLCRAFLTKCSLFFSLQPQTFATEASKVALVLTLLSGKAALWGTAVWENCHPCCSSFRSLSHHPHHLRQSLRDYHVSRHPLTTGSGCVRSPLAHTTQSSGGLGSQHHL